jgi:NADP-dependent 3-hydroxy acid dehydrogenase YdfG
MAKTVVVSPATAGIGEAMVEALVSARYRVIALGRSHSPHQLEKPVSNPGGELSASRR